MAEQVQRHRQYEYRANSNLVLTTEHARGSRNDEPSGEPDRRASPASSGTIATARPRGLSAGSAAALRGLRGETRSCSKKLGCRSCVESGFWKSCGICAVMRSAVRREYAPAPAGPVRGTSALR